MIGWQVALAVFYFLLFTLIIYQGSWFAIAGVDRKIVTGAFWLKLFFGFLFWAVYSYYYGPDHGSDTFAYFEEGLLLNEIFYEDPVDFFRLLFFTNPTDPELLNHISEMDRWNRAVSYGVLNDNPTIIKFNAIVAFFSLGYFHTHTLFMGFVSFSGLMLIYRFFEQFTEGLPNLLLFATVILPPSLLFWGSGVMKEGLLLFGLGMLLYSFILLHRKRWIKAMTLSAASVLLLLFTKAYVLIAFSPALIYFVLIRSSQKKQLILKFIALHAALFIFVFTLGYWVSDYDVLHMLQLKQKDFYNLNSDLQIGSIIEIPRIRNVFDLILNAPTALVNTYFRPHLLEATNVSYLASAIENLLYLFLIGIAVWKFRRPSKQNLFLILFCLSCVVGLGLLIGLITPILGAVVRYKIPALPFLVILCLLLMQPWISSLTSSREIEKAKN